MEFLRQEYWNGLPFLTLGDLYDPGIEPASVVSLALAGRFFTSAPPGVQFSSVAEPCPTLCNPMDCSRPGFPVHHQLPELAQTHVHQLGDIIQPSHPPSSPSPPALNLSQHQVSPNKSVPCIRWPKDWSFSFSISPSNEYSGLIFFKIDWFDLLAVQGTFKSLLHHNSKASILRH